MIFIVVIIFLISGCASEEDAWKEALESNTIESYEKFLEIFPDGDYAEEALWQKADMVNTIDVYEKYMDKYPEGEYFSEAKKELSDLKWQKTLEEDTIESYEKYLDRFPFGYHSNAAKEELLWYQLSEEDTVDGYARYLRVFPEGKYYEIAKEAKEELLWVQVLDEDTIDSYARYLRIFPEGKYYKIAKEKTSLARIKLDVTIYRYKPDKRHFCIENELKNKLTDSNFFVATEDYDATLFVDYKENKGEIYTSGDYGTIIQCELILIDNKGNLLYEESISAKTSYTVRSKSPYTHVSPDWFFILYDSAVRNFKRTDEYQNLMHDITKIFDGQS